MPRAGIGGPIMRPRLSAHYVGERFRRAAVGRLDFGQGTGAGPAIEAAPETFVSARVLARWNHTVWCAAPRSKGDEVPGGWFLTAEATVDRHRRR